MNGSVPRLYVLFAAADLLEEGVEVLPLVLEKVDFLLALLVVDGPPLALPLLYHLHLFCPTKRKKKHTHEKKKKEGVPYVRRCMRKCSNLYNKKILAAFNKRGGGRDYPRGVPA